MSTTTALQDRFISLKIIQPVVISAFTVLVLAASFMVGKHVGYAEGVQHTESQQAVPLATHSDRESG